IGPIRYQGLGVKTADGREPRGADLGRPAAELGDLLGATLEAWRKCVWTSAVAFMRGGGAPVLGRSFELNLCPTTLCQTRRLLFTRPGRAALLTRAPTVLGPVDVHVWRSRRGSGGCAYSRCRQPPGLPWDLICSSGGVWRVHRSVAG